MPKKSVLAVVAVITDSALIANQVKGALQEVAIVADFADYRDFSSGQVDAVVISDEEKPLDGRPEGNALRLVGALRAQEPFLPILGIATFDETCARFAEAKIPFIPACRSPEDGQTPIRNFNFPAWAANKFRVLQAAA